MGTLKTNLGNRVYVDANIIVYVVEGYAQHQQVLRSLLAEMDAGRLAAVTSELTLAEVLVKPMRDANEHLVRAYAEFLEPSRALTVAPLTRPILIDAARIRASGNLKLPDAVHVATAIALDCDTLLTNDQSLRGSPGIEVKLLSQVPVQ